MPLFQKASAIKANRTPDIQNKFRYKNAGNLKKFTIKECEHLSDDEAKTADNRLIARFLQCVPRGGNKIPDAKKPTLTRDATKGRFSNIV